MRSLGFLVFVVLTFCCWGIYGPVLHIGQEKMGDGPKQLSSLRPFICVGIAYFLIAVVYPILVLKTKGEQGNWSVTGFVWSFVAGAVGAIGAMGIILAFKFQGKPVYVMPLVFGLAPIVNTLVTMLMAGTIRQASLKFYVGIILVAVGAAGVLTFKPKADHPTAAQKIEVASEDSQQAGSQQEEAKTKLPARSAPNWLLISACIAVTAMCWGAYGPVLHKGQAKMGGSRLRPFLCVGLAYFAIAVIVPLLLMGTFEEPGGWFGKHLSGMFWSLGAGAAGAIGALGIIYAFNFGGKPIFVMPLVFGFAPVINTLTETVTKSLLDKIELSFLVSLSMVIIGAVIVLVFAPRVVKPKPANEPAIT